MAEPRDLAEELRAVAKDVRGIGDGWRQDPEAIAVAKDDIARRLGRLASEVERAPR